MPKRRTHAPVNLTRSTAIEKARLPKPRPDPLAKPELRTVDLSILSPAHQEALVTELRRLQAKYRI